MPRPAGSPPQLKWHNTLPQHFAGFHSATQGLAPSRGSHKRQISSPDGIEAAFNAAVHASEKQATLTAPRNSRVLASPTKRQRSTQDLSSNTVTTPVKIQPNSGGIRSAGSGMQTPPPSSMGKRRGRPPKGASTNGHEVVMGRSPISSPTKQVGRSQTTQSASQSIPPITLNFHQDISTSHNMQENYSQLGLSVKSSTELTQDFGYCDASSPLGWAELPSGVGFDSDLPDIFGGADIYHGFPLLDQSDPTAFSFQDNESDCYPYVDPNMLFSSRATSAASSQIDAYGDDADDGLSPVIEKPYQHQYNYRKRERELELKRLQKKERAAKQMNESANLRVPPYNGFDSFSLKHSASESVLTSRREANFKAATLDAAVTRQLARSKSRDRMTPPGSRGGLDSLAVPKMPKIKTSVQFSISPSGRAKTETKVIYGSDTEPDVVNTELETFKVLDESLESDSSFDEAEPRGLAPGGKFYSNTKKPKKNAENVTPRSKPRLGKFQMTPMTEYARSFDWGDSDEEPPTPTKASGKKPYRQISAEFQSTTPRRRNPFDQQLLSSPRLLTPITSSPAKYNRRHTGVSVSLADLKMSSARKLKSMREESDESEAETVVDDPGSAMNFPIASLDNGSDGDALEALKNVVAKRRTSHQVSSPIKTPINSRPGTASKHHMFSSGTHSVISRAGQLPANANSVRKIPPSRSLRRRRTMPDGGYAHGIRKVTTAPAIEAESNSSTEPDSGVEEELGIEDVIRCICGMDEDGGTMMVQCDSCNGWLHLRCVGLHRKALPETFVCTFCIGDARQNRGQPRRVLRPSTASLPQTSRRSR